MVSVWWEITNEQIRKPFFVVVVLHGGHITILKNIRTVQV
jgi:hypothetical protein